MGDNFDVDPSDFTFATTTGPLGNISLGEAGSCHGDANKTAYGYFRINTPGTGVHIDTGKGAYKVTGKLRTFNEYCALRVWLYKI